MSVTRIATEEAFLSNDLAYGWLYLTAEQLANDGSTEVFAHTINAATAALEDAVGVPLRKSRFSYRPSVQPPVHFPYAAWPNVTISTVKTVPGDAVVPHTYDATTCQLSYTSEDLVLVEFFAGYGASETAPEDLRNAALRMLAHLWEHRGDQATPLPPDIVQTIRQHDTWQGV